MKRYLLSLAFISTLVNAASEKSSLIFNKTSTNLNYRAIPSNSSNNTPDPISNILKAETELNDAITTYEKNRIGGRIPFLTDKILKQETEIYKRAMSLYLLCVNTENQDSGIKRLQKEAEKCMKQFAHTLDPKINKGNFTVNS